MNRYKFKSMFATGSENEAWTKILKIINSHYLVTHIWLGVRPHLRAGVMPKDMSISAPVQNYVNACLKVDKK